MKKEKYKYARSARRALRDIEQQIKNAALEAVQEHRAVMIEADMEDYLEAIIDEFWNNSFESVEAAKAEADLRMKQQSKVRFWSDRLMSILKMTMNAISKKLIQDGKEKALHSNGCDQLSFAERLKMEVRNSANNQSISIWQIQEN